MNREITLVFVFMLLLLAIFNTLPIAGVTAYVTHHVDYASTQQYELTVTSAPITGISFTINGTPYVTPYSSMLPEGSYTIEMPEIHDGYFFHYWGWDCDTNRVKTITLDKNITLTAIYLELEIFDFYSCDQLGNFQSEFEKGSKLYFNLTVRNPTYESKNMTIVVIATDTLEAIIGREFFNTTILSGSYERYIINLTIPIWACIGHATGYANIFDVLFAHPMCPEKRASFTIVDASSPFNCTLTIDSLPSGVTFTVEGIPHEAPWEEPYRENASIRIVMPSTHVVGETEYSWSQWSDGISSRTRTATLNANFTLTAIYSSTPVGGIYVPVNKLELLAPYLGLTTLLAVAVVAVVYVKKRKKDT